MKEWNNIVIVDVVVSFTIRNEKFIFVPFVPPGRFEEALDTLDDTWTDASCIFAHQEIAGCKMGAIISIEGDKWTLDKPQIISGHIHSKQTPQANVYYPGSALQHAFGESETNIIPCLTFEGKRYDIDEVDLLLPRKKIVYMDVESIENYILPDEATDKIKITVSGNYDEFKALKKTKKYKDITSNGVTIVFKQRNVNRVVVKDEVDGCDSDFHSVLERLVCNQKNPYLYKTYEMIVNNKEQMIDDIFFL